MAKKATSSETPLFVVQADRAYDVSSSASAGARQLAGGGVGPAAGDTAAAAVAPICRNLARVRSSSCWRARERARSRSRSSADTVAPPSWAGRRCVGVRDSSGVACAQRRLS